MSQFQIEVNCQLNAPAALPPWKEANVRIGETKWTLVLSGLRDEEKDSARCADFKIFFVNDKDQNRLKFNIHNILMF
jgi:hypothetical protein